ncbi:MAG: short-chain dehydrogenase [Alphaproteobacteria bacterium]|nr:short-chain dehydrogenase [Alphaproteobacteria bacterium]
MSGASEQAVVVGAGGAIGAYIVDALVDAGLRVVGVGRDAERMAPLADRHGDRFIVCVADIADDSSIETIRAALGALAAMPVAMVVHAPGVPVAGGVKAAATQAVVEACNVKVAGFMRLVRAVEPKLRRGSRLVAIGGHYGFEPSPYAATAGVANAGLANVVRQMSWAYGGDGITSHLVAPGPADTERLRQVVNHRAAAAGTDAETELAALRSESAIGELTTPGQVAWAVRMLLAPEADALAGSSLMLDSGRRRGMP